VRRGRFPADREFSCDLGRPSVNPRGGVADGRRAVAHPLGCEADRDSEDRHVVFALNVFASAFKSSCRPDTAKLRGTNPLLAVSFYLWCQDPFSASA